MLKCSFVGIYRYPVESFLFNFQDCSNNTYFCSSAMKLQQGIRLAEIAGMVKGKVMGDPDAIVTGINEIHRVEYGDLTFVDHPKYYDKALSSAATFVIINKEVEVPAGKGLIFSDDPFRDYVYLTKRFMPFVPSSQDIDPSAKIGKGTIIQPNVSIGPEVKIGENCVLHSGVVIYSHCELGDNVILHANTVIGADAFYYKRRPDFYEKMHSCGRVLLHDHVEIGACCTIDRGVSSDTIIGKGTKLDNHVHIGHDTVIGKNCLFAAQVAIAGCVNIEDDVIFWGQVGCQKDVTIGAGAIVYAQSGISKSLKGGTVYFGSPAKEAREKMKEMALVSRLPEVFEKIK